MKRLFPAYPLFVKDPYFSIWAQTEILNEKDVIFWTGTEKKLYGYIKVDGEVYSFLGNAKNCKRAKQLSLSVSAFTTDYTFKAGKAKLSVSFVSPLPPDILRLLSCPVCYMNYTVKGAKSAEVIIVADQCLCYNGEDGVVCGGVEKTANFEAAHFGLKGQNALSCDWDEICADWGYWYLCGERAYYASAEACEKYIKDGTPLEENGGSKALMASSKALSGKIMLGFDDTASINYFGDILKGYYLENDSISEALEETFKTSLETDKYLAEFDKRLTKRAAKFGKEYINILYASLRQSVGAHKLVKDKDGQLLFLSKECRSNGCIGTVDVSYPSMPLYLLYNPELVRAMLRPIFKFAKMPVWKYDFAPHDVGSYPNCCGQVYGLREQKEISFKYVHVNGDKTRPTVWTLPADADVFSYESQMPVEECANVLIMLAAAYKADGSLDMVNNEFDTLEKWVNYLVKFGLKPENQLCTDDFSGHLKNNLNLAIKAVVGIACFAEICKALGKAEAYAKYRKTAEEYVAEITGFAKKFNHLPLTWDTGEETYSLKYNVAFDKILGLKLFPEELCESEIDYYLTKANEYGVPLDNRAEFTKSDWLVWTACLTNSLKKQRKLLQGIDAYLRQSEDRLPFGDWYETKTGRLIGFRNRTVVGGHFILLLLSVEK
ncbi:MAG: DUF4965 domain-containing protein [Clostridia bacterium]|nr:DUF4965 domain-containing protein [Clostridia bacterium]